MGIQELVLSWRIRRVPASMPHRYSLGLILPLIGRMAAGDFQSIAASFGEAVVLAGVHHSTTTNPDGTSINFWSPGFEGVPGKAVGLSNPHMAAADAYGNVFVADKSGHAILKIGRDGIVHTFAGTHIAGFNGDGPAQANSLQISNPNGLYVLPSGVVYLLDPGNHRIRRVGLDGQMTTIVNDTAPDWAPSGRALWVSGDEQLIYYAQEFPPVPPAIVANGAVLKSWTAASGIQILCTKAVGFRNPGNMDVNPVDGRLYVTDRAEEDTTKAAMGLFRIDGIDQRTRITGNGSQPVAADGKPALTSFIQEPRGLAFLPDGSYFICGHKDGSVWYVDTSQVLHQYLNGSGKKDGFVVKDGLHPPLTDQNYFAQPRSVTLAPNGDLLVVCNDSGYVFRIKSAVPSRPSGLRATLDSHQDLVLQWTGEFGRGYRVERSFDLKAASWTPVSAVGADRTRLAHFTEPTTGGSHAFYRVLPSL